MIQAPLRELKSYLTRAALVATSRIQSAACYTTNIHRTGKPVSDERGPAQDQDQDEGVQQKVSQSVRLSLFLL
jgi:hypothetical protein